MTEEKKLRKNTDYSASAEKLTNPPEIAQKLTELHNIQSRIANLDMMLQAMVEYEEIKTAEKKQAEITAEIRGMIDTLGSYQDVETGSYAVKQRKESITYQVNLVRQHLPANLAQAIIREAVDEAGIRGLLKGGLITAEQNRQCGEVKESYAYIIK